MHSLKLTSLVILENRNQNVGTLITLLETPKSLIKKHLNQRNISTKLVAKLEEYLVFVCMRKETD